MKHYTDVLKYLTEKLEEAMGVPREYMKPEFNLTKCPKCSGHGRLSHTLTTEEVRYTFYVCKNCDTSFSPYQTKL